MVKIPIAKGIVRYSFEPHPGKHFSDTIYALISGKNVLLIDAGYESEGGKVAEDLVKNGLELTGVIISHFHDDHMQGLKALRDVPVYGSSRYQQTLDLWTEKVEHEGFTPTVTVENTFAFSFGPHRISIIPSPGHSACTVLVDIDGVYLHVADELMFSPEQEPILPVADPGCLGCHIETLIKLKAYKTYTLLPAHGLPLCGAEEITRQIEKRLAYLTAMSNSNRRLSYEEASRESGGFLHSEWHSDNYSE